MTATAAGRQGGETLAPCPFCGGDAMLADGYAPFVSCRKCHAETDHIGDAAHVIGLWNRRAEQDSREAAGGKVVERAAKGVANLREYFEQAIARLRSNDLVSRDEQIAFLRKRTFDLDDIAKALAAAGPGEGVRGEFRHYKGCPALDGKPVCTCGEGRHG